MAYGLALSGGGYRATLFHLGAILRIIELGRLRSIGRVASVSGGSFAAGLLAAAWPGLEWDGDGRATNLGPAFMERVLDLTSQRLDIRFVALGLISGINPARALADHLDRSFFSGLTLQHLPGASHRPHVTAAFRSLPDASADYRAAAYGVTRARSVARWQPGAPRGFREVACRISSARSRF